VEPFDLYLDKYLTSSLEKIFSTSAFCAKKLLASFDSKYDLSWKASLDEEPAKVSKKEDEVEICSFSEETSIIDVDLNTGEVKKVINT